MFDESVTAIAIGDEVRVHYHRPGLTRSFVEGLVSRVDVSTLAGRVFVIDVTYDLILDRDQPVRTGYQNYVLYDHKDDFPGRIEVLSKVQREPASVQEEGLRQRAEQTPELEAEAAPEPEPQAATESERETATEPDLSFEFPPSTEQQPQPELETEPEPIQATSKAENASKWTNVVTALFRK